MVCGSEVSCNGLAGVVYQGWWNETGNSKRFALRFVSFIFQNEILENIQIELLSMGLEKDL